MARTKRKKYEKPSSSITTTGKQRLRVVRKVGGKIVVTRLAGKSYINPNATADVAGGQAGVRGQAKKKKKVS